MNAEPGEGTYHCNKMNKSREYKNILIISVIGSIKETRLKQILDLR